MFIFCVDDELVLIIAYARPILTGNLVLFECYSSTLTQAVAISCDSRRIFQCQWMCIKVYPSLLEHIIPKIDHRHAKHKRTRFFEWGPLNKHRRHDQERQTATTLRKTMWCYYSDQQGSVERQVGIQSRHCDECLIIQVCIYVSGTYVEVVVLAIAR